MRRTVILFWTLVLAVAVFMPAITWAGGRGEGQKAEITWACNEQPQLTKEFWQDYSNRFMAKYPNVKVTNLYQPSSDTLTVYLKTLLATGEFPDISVMQSAADFVPAGALLAYNDSDLSMLADPNIGKINGKQYVATYKKMIMGMFYNKKYFADNGLKVPTTYNDFIKVCDTLKAKGIVPVALGMKDADIYTVLANMILGADVLAKDPTWGVERNQDKVKFDSPDFVKAMQKFQKICMDYTGPNRVSLTYEQMLEQFFNGKAAMLPIGQWVLGQVASQNAIDVGFFTFPGDTDANTIPVYVNEGLAISAKTKNVQVAKDFVKNFFADKEWYAKFLKAEELFPTTKEPVSFEASPLRKALEPYVAPLKTVEGFESMTGSAALLPGLKSYFAANLTQRIATGGDIKKELDLFDAEWVKANNNLKNK